MKEKIRRLGADLRFAYTFPFSRSGFIPFLILCGCTLVPFLGLFVTGIAFCLQTGRPQDRKFGRFIGVPIKMGIAAAVYAAPILVLQLLIRFAEPLNAWLGLALLLPLIWFSLRFLLLYPMAMCAIAYKMPLRTAVDGGEMKLALSGCTGRVILSGILLLPLLPLAGLITRLPVQAARILGAVCATLASFLSGGLLLGAFRKAYSMPAAELPRFSGKKAAAMLLAVLLMGQSFLPARAIGPYDDDVQPVHQGEDGSVGGAVGFRETFSEALQRFGLPESNGRTYYENDAMFYDEDAGHFVLKEGVGALRDTKVVTAEEMEVAAFAADVATDMIPGVGQVKNGCKAVYYGFLTGYNAYKGDTEQVKLNAASMGWSLASFATGGLSKLATAADALGHYDHALEGMRLSGWISRETAGLTDSSHLSVYVFDGAVDAVTTIGQGVYEIGSDVVEAVGKKAEDLYYEYKPIYDSSRFPETDGSYYAAPLSKTDTPFPGYEYTVRTGDTYITLDELSATLRTSVFFKYKYELLGYGFSGNDVYVIETEIPLFDKNVEGFKGSTAYTATAEMKTAFTGEGYTDGGGTMTQNIQMTFDISLWVKSEKDGTYYVDCTIAPTPVEGQITTFSLELHCTR